MTSRPPIQALGANRTGERRLSRFAGKLAFLLTLLGWMLSGIADAEETTVKRAAFGKAVVLRGAEGSAAFAFSLPTAVSQKRGPVLHLSWTASELIDKSRSTLSVVVDGRPVRTAWLERLASRDAPYESLIPLGALGAGVHVVNVASRLTIDDDPCLQRHEEGAWLSIDEASHLRFTLTTRQLPRPSLGNLPQALRDAAGDGVVHLTPPGSLDLDTARAVVETQNLLSQWGLETSLDPQKSTAGVRLYASDESIPPLRDLVRALQQAPKRVIAAVETQGQGLVILARHKRRLSEAVRQLGSDRLRQMCPDSEPCLLSASDALPPPSEPQRQSPATVLTLKDIGYPTGWTATGPGTHTLRFVWQRPGEWQIRRPPRVQIDLSLSSTKLLDAARTHLTLSLNERPLSTWAIADKSSGRERLRVKIPRDFWKEPTWAFEVVVRLEATDNTPCHAADDAPLWAVLGSDTQLQVSRGEPAYQGLASFYTGSSRERPLVVWSDLEHWSQVLNLARVLRPFAQQTPEASWRFVADVAAATSRFILVASSPDGLDSSLLAVAGIARSFWLDHSRELGVPATEIFATSLLIHRPVTPVTPEHVVAHLAPGASMPSGAPPYKSLLGRYALWTNERWFSLGQERHADSVVTVEHRLPPDELAAEHLASEEQRLVQRVNAIWALLVALVCGGLALYWWRRPRGPNRTSVDIEEMNPEER